LRLERAGTSPAPTFITIVLLFILRASLARILVGLLTLNLRG
jgi:hypothetical protein